MDMVMPPAKKQLGHSLKYLAAKAAKEEKKRKRQQAEKDEEEQRMNIDVDDEQVPTKRARVEEEEEKVDPTRLQSLIKNTLTLLAKNITTGTSDLYKSLYGSGPEEKIKQQATEIAASDRKQFEQDIRAYKLAQRVSDELRAQTVDELVPKSTDLKRSGIYLEDVNWYLSLALQ